MNEELLKLYNEYWPTLVSNAALLSDESDKRQPSHPLLIKVNEKYENAKIKVMIVGQETDGWCESMIGSERSPDGIANIYFNYFYETTKKAAKAKNKRPFWNKSNFKYFKDGLEKELGSDNVGFIWNNLSKIGKNSRGATTKKINKLEGESFSVHIQELDILKPDVIIFNTGSDRDYLLKQRFNVTLSNTHYADTKKEVAKVGFSGKHEKIISFRTFHPNARAYVKTRRARNTYIIEQVIESIKMIG